MAIPLAVSAGLGLVSTGLGMFDMIKGGQQRRQAEQDAIKFGKEIEEIQVKNVMGELALPKKAAELELEASKEALATGVEAAKAAGAEGVIGLVPKLQQQAGRQALGTAARLEQLEYQRNLEMARQAQAIENQNVNAQRQLGMMRLQGAGMAAAEGSRRQQAGLQSMIGGLGQAAALGLEYSPLYQEEAATRKANRQAKREMKAIQGDNAFATIEPIAPVAGLSRQTPQMQFPSLGQPAALNTSIPAPFHQQRGGIPNVGFSLGAPGAQQAGVAPMQPLQPVMGQWNPQSDFIQTGFEPEFMMERGTQMQPLQPIQNGMFAPPLNYGQFNVGYY